VEEDARQARAAHLVALAEGNEARTEDDSLSASERKAAQTRAQNQRSEAERINEAGESKGGEEDDEPTDKPGPDGNATTVNDTKAEMPSHEVKHTTDGAPHEKAQRNFTDPDSSIMEHKGGFEQAYNGQVVANDQQVILSHGLSNCAADTKHLPPMIDRTIENVGTPEKALADAGYWSPENAAYCEENGVDAYIATSRESKNREDNRTGNQQQDRQQESGVDPPPPPAPLEQMRSKLRTPEGREEYRARKWMVEPVFGQIKGAMGFRMFTMRGLEAARGEWGFVCACHNLRKLYRRWLAPGELATT